MKRFSETNKWEDPWFRKLKPKFKTFLLYLFDRCDNAGVWVVDTELAAQYVGERIDPEEALKVFSGRVVEIGKGKWLIPQFVSFQYGVLKETCHPHKRIMENLVKHSLKVGLDGKTTLVTTLVDTPSQGLDTLEEEDKEEDKEKEVLAVAPKIATGGEEGLTIPQNLRTEGFLKAWALWVPFRKKIKSCKDWVGMFQAQLDWLGTFPEPTATAMVEQSRRNGWQGIQEVKGGYSGAINAAPKAPTIHEIRAVIEAKEKTMKALKDRYTHENAHGLEWSNEERRKEYVQTKKEVKDLNEKLSKAL